MDEAAAARCFDAFDRERRGVLSAEQAEFAMAALLGLRPPRFEVARLVEAARARAEEAEEEEEEEAGVGAAAAAAGTGLVDRDTFVSAMRSKLARVDRDDVIRATFAAFDVGCRGFLVYEDVLKCFASVLPSVAPQLVREAFELADRDRDGRVGYGEFALLMRAAQEGRPEESR